MRRKSRKELDSEKTPLAGSEGPNLGTLSAEWTTSLEEMGGHRERGRHGGEVNSQRMHSV